MSGTPEQRLERYLALNRRLRDPVFEPRSKDPLLRALQRWQARRLAASYQDLLDSPRYHDAARFFLDDLYGESDFSQRDADFERILPVMRRLLPEAVLETAAMAVELHVLSQELDIAMVDALAELGRGLDLAGYGEAYRRVGRAEDRSRQIELIGVIGRQIDHWVHKRFILRTLKLARLPARMAGLSALQSFLERGFSAFAVMDGAGHFLATIVERETRGMEGLLAGEADPFALGADAP